MTPFVFRTSTDRMKNFTVNFVKFISTLFNLLLLHFHVITEAIKFQQRLKVKSSKIFSVTFRAKYCNGIRIIKR